MRKNQRGQALVLVLLSLAVVLTLVLFVLARSITDVAVSSRSQEAVRAFSAAEAGIESALVIGTGTNGQISIGDAKYNATVSQFAEGSTEYVYPYDMTSGDTMTTWFESHLDDGSLGCDSTHPCFSGRAMAVCWGTVGTDASSTTTPAIETSVFYGSPVKISRGAYDPNVGRITTNNFSELSDLTSVCSGYAFQKGINVSASAFPDLKFAKIRMLYNSNVGQPIKIVVTEGVLPSQGQDIVSTGSAGDSNRRVQVFQGWPEPPAMFNYAIYSGDANGLTKGN